jgi:carboxyl-terminal processing protease
MDVDNQGEFGGLGIEITINDGRLTVKQPLEGTPAAKAGLKAEDQIIRIEDESTVNMDLDEAVSKLRGPVGSVVNILVKRKSFVTPQKFAIKRDTIRINPVEGALLPGNIGYVKIKSFNEKAAADLDSFLVKFKKEGGGNLKGLVLDLRDNPGGYLNQAVEVADRFLDDGVIVSTVEGANQRRDEQRATRPGTEPAYPVAVLVNGNSASASEIVAGAIKNLDRGIIIGERTFGKGSVQHLYNNADTSKLKLTVAKYLTPGDHSIQSIGIPPDIALEPSVIRPAEKRANGTTDDPTPLISLYWREWVSREADLDHHLDGVAPQTDPPAYSLRYLRPEAPEGGAKVDPAQDWEVQFARDVLAASPSAHRAELLKGAGAVIASRQKAETTRINAAFQQVKVDWTAGTNPRQPALDVSFDLGPDGVVKAGEAEDVAVVVTNKGTEPLFQISAVTTSENAWLDHREFYFGRINPGETRRAPLRVILHDGYGSELASVKLRFRDATQEKLAEQEVPLRTEGLGLPRFEYAVTLRDDGSGRSKGDGDGTPEVGEIIDLEIAVKNVGAGPTAEAFVRVKNRSGRSLDLSQGRFQVGEFVKDPAKPCKPDEDDCPRRLDAGSTFTDRVTFELREAPADGAWKIDLQVGDNQRYDYASVQRGGFYDYFQMDESLLLSPGKPLASRTRVAPRIELTVQPGVEAGAANATLSGVVRDDQGIRDVMVFHGEEKIFDRGGGEDQPTVPFSVEPSLVGGNNLLYVLARDYQGLSATTSVNTYLPQSKAPPKP